MKRLRKWTVVIVEWLDAVTTYEHMHSDEKLDPVVRRTVGFLIAKNRKGITVAMEDDRDAEALETDCQTVTTIPAKMIKKVIPMTEWLADDTPIIEM